MIRASEYVVSRKNHYGKALGLQMFGSLLTWLPTQGQEENESLGSKSLGDKKKL